MGFGDLLGFILGIEGKLLAADMVEYNPREDRRGLSGATAATLARELLILMG